jgi:hypothetical protein
MKFLKSPASCLIFFSLLILAVRYVFSATGSDWFYEMYGYYGISFVEPLEIVAVTLLGVSVWVDFFTLTVQKKWWRIARWFIGFVALILTFSLLVPYQGGGFISFPGVRELIFLWGLIFGLFTVGFTLFSRK